MNVKSTVNILQLKVIHVVKILFEERKEVTINNNNN